MPFKNPDDRRAYQIAYQRKWWHEKGRDRDDKVKRSQRKKRNRINRLLREPWSRCIVKLFTPTPCQRPPKWRDGNALYCDSHKPSHSGVVPWDGRPAVPLSQPSPWTE